MEKVDVTFNTYGNFLEITPTGKFEDNYVYEIYLNGLKELNGVRALPAKVVKVVTALTPAYASLDAVKSLIEGLELPDEIILYHIREASKFVLYVTMRVKEPIPFEVEQFVRFKAAHDSLLRYYITKAADSHLTKGQMGDVVYQTQDRHRDISDLLKYLKGEIKVWQDALEGYKLEGRAKPVSTLRGKSAQPPMTNLGLDFSRGL